MGGCICGAGECTCSGPASCGCLDLTDRGCLSSSCLRNSGCLGLSCLNLTEGEACEGGRGRAALVGHRRQGRGSSCEAGGGLFQSNSIYSAFLNLE